MGQARFQRGLGSVVLVGTVCSEESRTVLDLMDRRSGEPLGRQSEALQGTLEPCWPTFRDRYRHQRRVGSSPDWRTKCRDSGGPRIDIGEAERDQTETRGSAVEDPRIGLGFGATGYAYTCLPRMGVRFPLTEICIVRLGVIRLWWRIARLWRNGPGGTQMAPSWLAV